MPEIDFPRVLQPDEAMVLRTASLKALARLGASGDITDGDRRRIAEAVIWVARSGYARDVDGSLDADMLADAALARIRAVDEA